MASSFIGLPVSISLRSGLTLQGTVQSVNAVQGTIVLSSSHLFQPGQDPTIEQGEYLGTRAVGRTEVVGLEVVSVSKGEQQQQPSYTSQPSPSYPSPHSPLYTSLEGGDDLSSSPGPRSNRQGGRRGGGRKVKGKGYQGGDAGETGNEADLSTAAWEEGRGSRGDGTRRRNPPSQSQSQSSYGHQQQQQSHHSQQQHHSPSHHQSHSQQQQQSFSEEFDFGAGLRSFNKKAVFEEIRAQDLTDPSLLLVSHNRSSPHPHANNPKMVKMRPNESVLSRRELEEQEVESRGVLERLALGGGGGGGGAEEEESGGCTAEESTLEEEEEEGMHTAPEEEEGERSAGEGKGWVTARGYAPVVVVSKREWSEVLSIADIESLPTPTQRLSTTSTSLTSFLLSLPQTQQQTSSVILLINAPNKGELVLRAGVHLLNRGVKVTAWVARGLEMGEGVREGLRMFSTSTGRIVRSLADLSPTYDLIIDALSDDEGGAAGGPSVEEMAAGRWVNEREGSQVVSVECPWGWEEETGAPLLPNPLHPTYLISLGALQHSASTLALALSLSQPPSSAPELVVLDVGLPPHLWARCGVEGFETAGAGGGGRKGMAWEEGWWTRVVRR